MNIGTNQVNLFQGLKKYIKTYYKYIGGRVYVVFVLTILAALAQGLGFTMLLPLLRVTQSSTNRAELDGFELTLHKFLQWIGISESLFGILLFIVAIFLVKGIVKFVQVSYVGYLQASLLKELKLGFLDAYNGMSYEYYVDKNAGHFINIINAQVRRFFRSFQRFTSALSKMVSSLSFFGFAFAISLKFASVVLLTGLVLLGLFRYINEYVRGLSRRVAQEMSTLNEVLVQSLQSFKYLISTSKEKNIRRKVTSSVNKLTGDIFYQRIAGAFTKAVREPISVIIISGVVLVQAFVFNEPLTPIFVALLLFHKGIQKSIGLQEQWQRTMDRIGSVEAVDDEMRRVLENQENNGHVSIDTFSDGLEMRNVSYSYNKEDGKVLEDFNMHFQANETIALVGKSGAGKSTIIDLITLLLKPDSGEIYIDGIAADNMDLRSWRSSIGYVSQETCLFDDTIEKNITLWEESSSRGGSHEKVVSAAKKACAHEFIMSFANGYQTQVGESGVKLSGGERQRLFLARELYKEPEILLLDEATSDLDSNSERKIGESLEKLKGQTAIVMIAHRLSSVKDADRIYVIEDGKIVEKGSFSNLKKLGEKFSNMIEAQKI